MAVRCLARKIRSDVAEAQPAGSRAAVGCGCRGDSVRAWISIARGFSAACFDGASQALSALMKSSLPHPLSLEASG